MGVGGTAHKGMQMTMTESEEPTDQGTPEDLAVVDFVFKFASEKAHNTMAGEDYISPIELARMLGIRPQVIYNYMRQGRIQWEYYTTGAKSTKVIRLAEMHKYLKDRFAKEAKLQEQVEKELRGE